MADNPELVNAVSRLRTFYEGSLGLSYSNPHVTQSALAAAGFVFVKAPDMVQCVYCNGLINNWEPGDIPEVEHRKHYPSCPGNTQQTPRISQESGRTPAGNESARTNRERTQTSYSADGDACSHTHSPHEHTRTNADDEAEVRATVPRPLAMIPPEKSCEYMDLVSRVCSFKPPWPTHYKNSLGPEHMAKAGFYYVGLSDQVRCFVCNCMLHEWEPEDDPIMEHKKWFPDCPVVKDYERTRSIGLASETEAGETCATTIPRPTGERGGRTSGVTQAGVPQGAVAFVQDSTEDDAEVVESEQALAEAMVALSLSSNAIPVPEVNAQVQQPAERCRGGEQESREEQLTEGSPSDYSVHLGNPSAGACTVCLDQDKGIAFIPCGHVACCVKCSYQVTMCPLCRKRIQNRIKVYL